MEDNFISASEIAEKLGLYLKVVTSVKAFDTYNSFFNIYDQFDEPCRRIVVLTPYEELEEVYDEVPDEPIIENQITDGNVWLKEYPLTVNPNSISIESIVIPKEKALHITNTLVKYKKEML